MSLRSQLVIAATIMCCAHGALAATNGVEPAKAAQPAQPAMPAAPQGVSKPTDKSVANARYKRIRARAHRNAARAKANARAQRQGEESR